METNDLISLASNIHTSSHPSSEYEVQLMMMTRDLGVYKARTTDVMKTDLLETMFLPMIKRINDGLNEGLTINPYDASDDDKEAIWSLPSDEVTTFLEAQNFFELPPDEMPSYDESMNDMDDVAALALRVQTRFGECVVFQKLASNYILKKSRKMIAVFTGTGFKELQEPAAFQVAKDAHVVYFKGNLYILNSKNFEFLFDYKVIKEKKAQVKLRDIEVKYAHNIILEEGRSLEEFLINDTPSLNKLQIMQPSIVLNKNNLLARKIGFDLKLNLDPDSGKMFIENRADAKLFISILNEEYLVDDITGDKFIVRNKKKVVVPPVEEDSTVETK